MDVTVARFVSDVKIPAEVCFELINGRVVDVRQGRYFEPGTRILVQGSKILSLDRGEAGTGLPKPTFTVDCQGKTILPGLFNTHCHITITSPTTLLDWKDLKTFRLFGERQMEKNMAECLAHGVTTLRDAYAEDLRRTRRLRERIQRGEIPGPRFLQSVVVGPTGGYLLEKVGWVMAKMRSSLGIPPVDHALPYSGGVEFSPQASEREVRNAVDRAIDERGAEVIKLGEQKENMTDFKPTSSLWSSKQLGAAVDQAQKRGLKTTIHQVSVDTFRKAVEAGVSSLAHLPRDGELTASDMESLIRQGLFSDPTLSVPYDVSYKMANDPYAEDPDMVRLTEFRRQIHEDLVRRFWIPEFQDGARKHHERADAGKMKVFGILPMTTMFRYYAPAVVYGARNLRLLWKSGARLTASNDGGIPPCTPAMIQHEMALIDLFLNKGTGETLFTGRDAVKMATIHSAECLGLEKDLGSLEAGKTADLVLLDGDPLTDPHLVGSPAAALFFAGRLVIDNCGLKIEKTG